jgi:hypothetical protein
VYTSRAAMIEERESPETDIEQDRHFQDLHPHSISLRHLTPSRQDSSATDTEPRDSRTNSTYTRRRCIRYRIRAAWGGGTAVCVPADRHGVKYEGNERSERWCMLMEVLGGFVLRFVRHVSVLPLAGIEISVIGALMVRLLISREVRNGHVRTVGEIGLEKSWPSR